MGKFAIECPKCGSVNTASSGWFAKKVITCGTCNEEIRVKEARLTSKVCPSCGKVFVYDQAKTKNRKCPSCGDDIDIVRAATASYKMVRINCPQCACSIELDKTKPFPLCPICDTEIDMAKELAKAELVSDTGISVIQYEGDNNTLIWKHPIEDFNLGSQLVVHESQEAIFFLNGEALDSFGPGRHTLETENLPVLKKIYSLPTGSQSPFHAEVYFINKTVQMGIKWGTDSRVRFIDPQTGIPLDLGAAGEMAVRVADARKLMFKLIGTTSGLKNTDLFGDSSANSIKKIFRAPIVAIVKAYLAGIIKEQNINILEIDAHLSDISSALHALVKTKLEEYGLTAPEFYVLDIDLPENDKNFKDIKALISQAYIGVRSEEVKASVAEAARQRELIEEQTRAQKELIRAQSEANALELKGMAEARVMEAKGYSQKDVLEADVKKSFAEGIGNMGGGSSGGGSAAGDIIGLMAGLKVAGGVLGEMDNMLQPQVNNSPSVNTNSTVNTAAANDCWTCTCGHSTNRGKFCEECGSPRVVTWDCACGQKGNTGKCCPECGTRKPD